MASQSDEAGAPRAELPKQHNFEDAARQAIALLKAQGDAQLTWLGATPAAGGWRLPVLDDTLSVDFATGAVRTSDGREVRRFWRILTLHYLSTTRQPTELEPSVAFADLPGGRTYAPVYQGRVIYRLCGTAGREQATLEAAARALGGSPVAMGDVGFDFRIYPRIRLRLIWHAGDEELPPSATILLPANIEAFFNVEDTVVLSEGLVARLGGKPF